MKKILIVLIFFGYFACFSHTTVEYVHAEAPQPLTTKELVVKYAEQYHVSQVTLNRIIGCESGFNADAIGDHGKSYGLVQIYLPSHKNISKADALDPEFAVSYLAKNIANNTDNWSCQKILKV